MYALRAYRFAHAPLRKPPPDPPRREGDSMLAAPNPSPPRQYDSTPSHPGRGTRLTTTMPQPVVGVTAYPRPAAPIPAVDVQ